MSRMDVGGGLIVLYLNGDDLLRSARGKRSNEIDFEHLWTEAQDKVSGADVAIFSYSTETIGKIIKAPQHRGLVTFFGEIEHLIETWRAEIRPPIWQAIYAARDGAA